MGTIRRYGPSSVTPDVTPAPDLGRGSQKVFETIQAGFDSVNKFIRPAVEQVQTAKGEAEAQAALEGAGPQWELQEKPGAPLPGQPGADPHDHQGEQPGPVQPGPTKAKAAALGMGATPTGGGWLEYQNQAATRNKPLSNELVTAMSFLPEMGVTMKVFSGGQDGIGEGTRRKGSTRHDHGKAGDVEFFKDGRKLSPKNPDDLVILTEIIRQAKSRGVTGFGEGDDYMGEGRIHIGFGAPGVWGAGGKAANAPEWLRTAFGSAPGGPTAVAAVERTEYNLKAVNGKSFEPRLPFTVRDAAFNATADRVISARAQEALETAMTLAQQKADGDIKVLREEMAKARTEVMANLPENLPGLKTDLEAAFTRASGVAERNAMALKERRMIAATGEAMKTQAATIEAEVQRLALTGGSSEQIAAALAQGQEALAAYGPREGFTLNGKVYAPDPTRAGIMSPADIAVGIGKLSADSHRIMIEAEFMKSEAPGQFVQEFRKEVFAGNSPLPPGESLALLSELQGRANAAESARRTAANAERERLEKDYRDRINPYVEMTEAGVPVAIPAAERASILANLAPYPELQRQAEIEFAVADAAVATHGMRGGEIVAYADTVRADLAKAAEQGQIDLEAVAVLQSLEDKVKKAQDAVTAEMIGLPMIEQLALDGATSDQIDWEQLRMQAAGNAEVLDKIDVVEAFYRDVESLDGMTADERDSVLREARDHVAELAMLGKGYGADALKTTQVIDKLTSWSEKRKEMAATDTMAFARSAGVAMPSLADVQSMADVGRVLADRVALISPLTRSEGVSNPVPLDPQEISAISEIFKESTRADQASFLAAISDLGADQAGAIFSKIGQSEPVLFAAGVVYANGNKDAATVILRGAADVKVGGGSTEDLALARTAAIGDLLGSDMIDPAAIGALDTAAMAYARGAAIAAGGREITQDDLETGYAVAMGQQQDGTGGVQYSRFGTTILPAGWDADRLDDYLGNLDDAALTALVGGTVRDASMEPYTARQLRRTIEQLRPSPEDPNILVPLDADGGAFLVGEGDDPEILTFDLRKMK